jgi:hypothetical protein
MKSATTSAPALHLGTIILFLQKRSNREPTKIGYNGTESAKLANSFSRRFRRFSKISRVKLSLPRCFNVFCLGCHIPGTVMEPPLSMAVRSREALSSHGNRKRPTRSLSRA